jgi:broad specificity phosphatase PhoE
MAPLVINFYFVRHGETPANVDHDLYGDISDHAFPLTALGVEQAKDMADFMKAHLEERFMNETFGLGKHKTFRFLFDRSKLLRILFFGNVRVYNSPYYRTRQTTTPLLDRLGGLFYPFSGALTYREDKRLIEHRVGFFDSVEDERFKLEHPDAHADCVNKKRDNGDFYMQFPGGEPRIDMAFRAAAFLETARKDAEEDNVRNVIIVCHGAMIRALIMELMNHPPEWFRAEKNPLNCSVRFIFGNKVIGYTDEGTIYPRDENAPLPDPMDTQKELEGAENVYIHVPQDPRAQRLKGVKYVDPFAKYRNP